MTESMAVVANNDNATVFAEEANTENFNALTLEEERQLKYPTHHHVNFFGWPIYHKCATPPATSLTILMSKRKGLLDQDKDMRKMALVSEALAFIDPVCYFGPYDVLFALSGTALKEAVTGRCAKLYPKDGTWLEEKWDEEEDVPLGYNDTTKSDVLFDGVRGGFLAGCIAPADDAYLRRLLAEVSNDVKTYTKKRAQWVNRPRSKLREVTCAAGEG